MLHTKHFLPSHLLFASTVVKFYFFHTKRWRQRDSPLIYSRMRFFLAVIKLTRVVEAIRLSAFGIGEKKRNKHPPNFYDSTEEMSFFLLFFGWLQPSRRFRKKLLKRVATAHNKTKMFRKVGENFCENGVLCL